MQQGGRRRRSLGLVKVPYIWMSQNRTVCVDDTIKDVKTGDMSSDWHIAFIMRCVRF